MMRGVNRCPARSALEQLFDFQLSVCSFVPPPAIEFSPAKPRRWRVDYAWPEQRVIVEIEGATWTNGRHSRGKGFEADCEKYNSLTVMGWRILRVTGEQVKNGQALNWLEAALKGDSR